MAASYDYTTGKMERDFHFVKWDTRCKGSGLPCKAGSDRCQKCEHYWGSFIRRVLVLNTGEGSMIVTCCASTRRQRIPRIAAPQDIFITNN